MPRAAYPNYYALLGVAPDADRAAIRASFRRVMHDARKHPDLGGDHAEAALLGEAYAVLRDPQRRLAYDRVYLQQCATAPMPRAAPAHDRRGVSRTPYRGMVLFPSRTHPGLSGQCRDLSADGCSFRTLRPLQTEEALAIIFQDDPGMQLTGQVRWQRRIPQRFGPPLYEGGVQFRGIEAARFANFLERVGI